LFTNCDLAGAIFNNTILEKANFTTARNYSINPQTNVVKKAKFSLPGVVGLLDVFKITIEL
jgi:fluoroquinolone resistance protein